MVISYWYCFLFAFFWTSAVRSKRFIAFSEELTVKGLKSLLRTFRINQTKHQE